MKLEGIGFYTLSDHRARNTSSTSPLWRCELLLTDKCNFSCPYCRGMRTDCQGVLPVKVARNIIDIWCSQGLKNIRYSGGEPTLYQNLPSLITQARDSGVERIAISTNGSASLSYYKELIALGVNDISVSLDACCATTGNKMAGRNNVWENIVENIKQLSAITYVTAGVVFTEETQDSVNDIIRFAHNLGVADIRIISSSQFNNLAKFDIPYYILDAHPILKYRVKNYDQGKNVRGIGPNDNHRCSLALDDMASAGGYHFPCIIYLREQGAPIGTLDWSVREKRRKWVSEHNTYADPICRNNCLDVCVEYNNRVQELH